MQPRPVRRMDDLGVEHQAVVAPPLVGDDGEGRVLRYADAREARGQGGDAVAVAHPDDMLLAGRPEAGKQRAVVERLDLGAAELAVVAALDLAAELGGHRHLPVADAEHRHAGLEHEVGRAWAAFVGHGGRAAGEDDRLRLQGAEGGFGLLERDDLAIDAGLAHAPRDELRHLAAEIDDEQLIVAGLIGHRLPR